VINNCDIWDYVKIGCYKKYQNYVQWLRNKPEKKTGDEEN